MYYINVAALTAQVLIVIWCLASRNPIEAFGWVVAGVYNLGNILR